MFKQKQSRKSKSQRWQKAIGAAVSKKRRKDPNKNRKGKAKNVSNTKGK